MRDSLRAGVEQAAAMTQLASLSDLSTTDPHRDESEPVAVASYVAEPPDGPTYAELADTLADDPAAIAVAIEEAIDELGEAHSLDTASKAALIQTLEMTPQSDWPVVIEEFTITLAALRTLTEIDTQSIAFDTPSDLTTEAEVSSPDAEPQATTGAPRPSTGESDDDTQVTIKEQTTTDITEVASAAIEPLPPTAGSNAQPTTDVLTAGVNADTLQPTATIDTTADDSAAMAIPAVRSPSTQDSTPQLCVSNACLARQVRGWGMVDLFSPNDLKPGAEIIVYFELTGLEATPTANGVVTSVGTMLQLEDTQGNRLHSWSFPPLTETCAAPRQDYFARYVVKLPNQLPAGDHRLVLSVTDLQAQAMTETSLALPLLPDTGNTTLAQD